VSNLLEGSAQLADKSVAITTKNKAIEFVLRIGFLINN